MKLGNGLYESRGYNARMQPTAIRVGTSTSETDRANRLSLSFDYGTTANNGNVLSQTIGRAGMSGTLTQYYRYDGANRLGLASEGGTAPTSANGCPTSAAWCRDYTYDAYGNRAVTGVRGHTLPAAVPSAVSAFSATTNRMTAGSYDAAGNLTLLTGVGRLGYDAENRLKTFDNAVASVQEQGTYVYDGLGQRVKRTTTIRGTSETTVYVYDAFGQLTAEYSSKAPAAGSGGRFFITQDHLGSTRLVTKQDTEKTVVECRDFFPFGERIASGLNGRSLTCYGGGSAVKQQFTGKERDVESSLDYFGARYYSARLGRFVSSDEPFVDQSASDPQSWNLYGYVRNNPLRFFDPTGRRCVTTDDGSTGDDGEGEPCREVVDAGAQQTDVYAYPQINPALALALRSAAFRAENTFWGFVPMAVGAGFGTGAGMAMAASSLATAGATGLTSLDIGSSGTVTGLMGTISVNALATASNFPGATIFVATALHQAPQAGRALSVATGAGARALARSAGPGRTVFTARIPETLVKLMENVGLAQRSTTSINGVQAQEIRFLPQATEFIVRFFK